MGNKAKDDELYQEMCRVVGKVVLEMRDLVRSRNILLLPVSYAPRWQIAKLYVQRSPARRWKG